MAGVNRERSMRARRSYGWCLCDRAMVSSGSDCPACGRNDDVKRLRKPAPDIRDWF